MIEDSFLDKGTSSITLDKLFIPEGLKNGFDGHLTHEIIINHILLHLLRKEKPAFPINKDKNIVTLPYEYWSNWEHGISLLQKGKIRTEILDGISWSSCPGQLPIKYPIIFLDTDHSARLWFFFLTRVFFLHIFQ